MHGNLWPFRSFQGLHNNDSIMLITGVACLALTVPPLFLACNLGEIVSIAFENANETIYQITWYACPVELQKCLVPMLLITERPFHMPVFGQLDCSRAAFKAVCVLVLLISAL